MITILSSILLLIAGASSELTEFTASSTRFSFDFFKRAYNPAENAVLSPISIHSSLSMFYPLAGNQVSPDMQKYLNLPADKTAVVDNLSRFFATANSESSEALKLRSKVYHAEAQLNPEVLPLFQGKFGAEVESADFHQAEKVVQSVNRWVEDATDGLIKEFMETGDLRVDNDLLLLNVVVLNATWNEPFDPEYTQSTPFRFLNGEHDVPLMHTDGEFPYVLLPEHNCYAVELPYMPETDLSMVVILPMKKLTLETIIRGLSLELYQALDAKLRTTKVGVAIPKFTMRKKLDAKELLKDMGLKSMFEKLDLNILTKDRSRIGEVQQTTFIKVDERGTEGAAATDVQAVGRSGHPSFYANRPFLYLIRKRSTKDIIFIGHYSVYEQ